MGGRHLPALILAAVALAAAIALASVGAAAAESRGLTIRVKASEATGAADAGEVRLYGASHALVIGIDAYTGGWPRLSNAVKDAEDVAAALATQGFDVTLRKNLPSADLKRAFEEFFAIKGEDPAARLFVWFAGHGYSEGAEGYIVPADAPRPEARAAFLLSALSLRRFGEYVRQARSKHAFAVFDSCFAGTIFASQRALPPAAVTRATALPVRQFLTSGDAGQKVSDDGTFRELFLRALRGEERADANGDGYLTASELGLFLTDRLTNLTGARQTPRYGKLQDKDWDRGDFVFALAQPQAPPPPAAATGGLTAEMLFWQSIQASGNPADFRAYLEQYPNGTFAALAWNRLAALAPGTTPEPSPEVVREAQRLLAELGYDAGPADGKVGSQTRAAIESFQRSNGLGVDGRVSDALLASLRVARRQVAAARPGPAPPPAPSPAKPAVGVYPERYKPGETFRDCPECPEMVALPAGNFRMGDLDGSGHSGENPVHAVTIARPFAVGKYEVTFDEWDACVAGGGCNGYRPSDASWGRGSRPVVNVSWSDAKAYVEWLARRTGKPYRLLSEAEWEYAARAGTTSPWSCGASEGCLGSVAWYSTNAGGRTQPVGGKTANAFGLFDMHGNVWERTEDCWHGSYAGAPADGSAWTAGGDCGQRVMRGGSWEVQPRGVRSAFRFGSSLDLRLYLIGFRVARTLD